MNRTRRMFLRWIWVIVGGTYIPVAAGQPFRINDHLQHPNQWNNALILNNMVSPQNIDRQGPTPGPRKLTAGNVQAAIRDAVRWLESQQMPSGHFQGNHGMRATALVTLALLAAGGDPRGDPVIQKALEAMEAMDLDDTYVRAIQANTWEYALRKDPENETYRRNLERDFKWLLAAKEGRRAWRYRKGSTDWDNSCTQYGVLGVWAAERAGFEAGAEFWLGIADHFLDCQNQDGGWGYQTSGSTPNMATAGLASLFLVFDMVHGKNRYRLEQPSPFEEGEAAKVLEALDRAMGWLGENQSSGGSVGSYYLYGIERSGVASGRKDFGGVDWYRRGAEFLLSRQRGDGAWSLDYGDLVSTSFCTLFLVYGGAPIVMNKLQYTEGTEWNANPRDLANVTKAMWWLYESPLNWQTVSIWDDPAEYDAPILFISGVSEWSPTDAQVARIRQYIERGGTVLAEPSDGSKAFRESLVKLSARLYPPNEYPDYQLKQLEDTHPIFHTEPREWDPLPRLSGMSDGVRTFFVLSDEYLSGDWQENLKDTAPRSFDLIGNLLFYVTDFGSLTGRFAYGIPEAASSEGKERVMVGRIRPETVDPDHPRDWHTCPSAWDVFGERLFTEAGVVVDCTAAVSLAGDLSDFGLLHLTATREWSLSESEIDALREYVENGGCLLVDACGGKTDSATSARRELEKIWGTDALQPVEDTSGLVDPGNSEEVFGTGRLRRNLTARRQYRDRKNGPLYAITTGDRDGVLFSEVDLTCALSEIRPYKSPAYDPPSARRIVYQFLRENGCL